MGFAKSFSCQTQPLLRLGWGFDNNVMFKSYVRIMPIMPITPPGTVVSEPSSRVFQDDFKSI